MFFCVSGLSTQLNISVSTGIMEIEWCADGGSFVQDGGPSSCFLQTFSGGMLNVIFVVLFIRRISSLLNLASLSYIQAETKLLLSGLQFLIACEAIFIVALATQLTISGSAIFFTVSEVFTWGIVMFLMALEVWKKSQWPSTIMKGFFFCNMFNHIVYVSILLHSNSDLNVVADILSVIIPLINIVLLCISVLKVYYYNEEEDDIRRSSYDFLNSNPLSRASPESTTFFQKLGNFLQESGRTTQYETPLEQPLRPKESSWSRWWGVEAERRQNSFNQEDDEVLDLVSMHGVHPQLSMEPVDAREGKSFWWWSKPSPPRPLQSAIVRNLASGDNPTQKQNLFSSIKNIWQRPPSKKDIEEDIVILQSESSFSSRNSNAFSDRSMSSSTIDSTVSVPSRALQMIMEQHKAKVSASNPLLEPRGSMHVFSSQQQKSALSPGGRYSSEQDAIVFQVTIQKWGIQSKKTPSPVLNFLDVGMETETAELNTEIEFEIIVTVRRNTDLDIPDEEWSASKGMLQKSTHNRWVVWKTTTELIRLYTSMFGVLGDLVPRRPKLKAEQKLNGVNYIYAESISDMRTISIFLNALLRNKHCRNVKPLEEFLQLEKAISLRQAVPNNPKDGGKEYAIFRSDNAIDGNGNNTNDFGNNSTGYTSFADGTMIGNNAIKYDENAEEIVPDVSAKSITASNNAMSAQDKWRKLFFNLRIKLKPKDIAVRCRLFEGVISGEEICAWLIRSSDTSTLYQQAANRFVDQDVDEAPSSETSNEPDDNSASTKSSIDWFQRFADLPGFIYRFPIKSDTAGSYSLFGATLTVKIPIMTYADENESMKTTRESEMVDILPTNENTAVIPTNESVNNAGIHVKYIIDISHGGDSWQTARRYREFEQLHKTLLKEGIKPQAALPSKSYMNKLARPVGLGRQQPMLNEERKHGLENYLSHAIQAVIDSETEKAMLLMAHFLDDDFNKLRIAPNILTRKEV